MTRWSRIAAAFVFVAGTALTFGFVRVSSLPAAAVRPVGCEFSLTAFLFCPPMPSFERPDAAPARYADQLRPCEDADTFRPSFCVGLPDASAVTDHEALVARRQDACAQLSPGESPGFCLVIPSTTTTDTVLQREVALVLLRERLGPDFRRIGGEGLDLWAESGVSGAVAVRLEALVREDAAFVEAYFARKLRDVPAVFVFSSQQSFALALEKQFGYSHALAGQLASQYGGLLVAGIGAIAINGGNVLGGERPTIFRHELTHVMAHQIAGYGLPMWLDEGLATLVAEADSSVFDIDRVTALSIFADDSIRMLAFDEDRPWIDRNAALGGNAYGVAAEAVRSISLRVGRTAFIALLDAVGGGNTLTAAYPEVTGEDLAEVLRSLPARVLAECAKGVVLSASRPDGLIVWSIYGFGSQRSVAISADGPSHYLFEVVTDRFGVHTGTVGPPMPAGTYALRAKVGATEGVMISVAVGTASPLASRACGV